MTTNTIRAMDTILNSNDIDKDEVIFEHYCPSVDDNIQTVYKLNNKDDVAGLLDIFNSWSILSKQGLTHVIVCYEGSIKECISKLRLYEIFLAERDNIG